VSAVPPVASKHAAASEQTEKMVASRYCLLRDAGYSVAEALALATSEEAVSAEIGPGGRTGNDAVPGDRRE
jgi:hypothetical protein